MYPILMLTIPILFVPFVAAEYNGMDMSAQIYYFVYFI